MSVEITRQQWAACLNKHCTMLVEFLQIGNGTLLNVCLEQDILTQRQVDTIKTFKTPSEKASEFRDNLMRINVNHYFPFLEILQSHQSDIADELADFLGVKEKLHSKKMVATKQWTTSGAAQPTGCAGTGGISQKVEDICIVEKNNKTHSLGSEGGSEDTAGASLPTDVLDNDSYRTNFLPLTGAAKDMTRVDMAREGRNTVSSTQAIHIREYRGQQQQSQKGTIDLDNIVKTWALSECGERKRLKKLKKNNAIETNINWSEVSFDADTVWLEDWRSVQTKMNIILQRVFQNYDDFKQIHTLRTEEKIKSNCHISVQSGFFTGLDVPLSLSLPCSIIELDTNFSKNINLTYPGIVIEKEVPWPVESIVKVKEHHYAEVKMIVEEKVYQADFQVTTKMSGTVDVTFTDTTKNSLICSVSGDIFHIMSDYACHGPSMDFIKFDDPCVIMTTKGKADISIGVKQLISTKQYPI